MAARFWVGGSGTWDNASTANWAATSGGASGASAPTTADTVTFDANSGTAATVTVAATAATSTCTVNKSDINLTLSGSPTFTNDFTLTTGTVTLGSNTLTVRAFSSSNSNTRTIAFGTGNITVTGNNLAVFNTAVSTNLSVTGTPVVNSTYAGGTGTRTIAVGPNTGSVAEAIAISVNVTAGTDIASVSGVGLKDVSFTGFSGTWNGAGNKTLYGSLTLSPTMSFSAGAGVITFAATSGTKTITSNGVTIDNAVVFDGVGGTFRLVDNMTAAATRTTTLTNGTLNLDGKTLTTGLFASANSNVRTIAFGTGNITTTGTGSVWFVSPVTNLTLTGTPVVNVNNNTAIATSIFTGTPTLATAFSFNFVSGTYTLAFLAGNGSAARNVNFTGFSGTWSATGAATVFGSLTLSTGMTLTASASALTFGATSGTSTITTNGKTVDFPLTFNGVGGTFAFADALALGSTRAFTVTNGTVRLKAGTTNTVGSFTTGAGTTQRFLQSDTPGTQATISDASGTNTATYLTIQDTAATGGATWSALLSSNNVDAGGNSGWNFGDYASSGLSRGVGLYAGAQGLWGGNSGLWGGFPGLQN